MNQKRRIQKGGMDLKMGKGLKTTTENYEMNSIRPMNDFRMSCQYMTSTLTLRRAKNFLNQKRRTQKGGMDLKMGKGLKTTTENYEMNSMRPVNDFGMSWQNMTSTLTL